MMNAVMAKNTGMRAGQNANLSAASAIYWTTSAHALREEPSGKNMVCNRPTVAPFPKKDVAPAELYQTQADEQRKAAKAPGMKKNTEQKPASMPRLSEYMFW
jgi:hypothetical protein